MAQKGYTDTGMGLAEILKEMEKLKSMCVKVGVTEDVGAQTAKGGVTVAQYATYNELGVMNKDESAWFIPPRPFVRGFADGKRELIAKTMEKLGGLVMDGKLDADTAIRRLGEFGQNGVKSYIRHGTFTPNADSTIARKRGSTKPLVDTKNLVNNGIRFQIIEKPVSMVSEK
jgi:predicted NUDIX family NTP pyrophosphohydrolase